LIELLARDKTRENTGPKSQNSRLVLTLGLIILSKKKTHKHKKYIKIQKKPAILNYPNL